MITKLTTLVTVITVAAQCSG